MKKLKIKYIGSAFKGRVRYGIFNDMHSWVSFSKKMKSEGTPVFFLMSYFSDEKEEKNNIFEEELK